MKRILLTVLAIFSLTLPLEADNRSTELLEKLEASIAALGNYRADFFVEVGEQRIEGHFRVAGDQYYMKLGDAEVYCDGRVRFEVDPERREVVIDRVNSESNHLLNNPTRAFDFLQGDFDHSVQSEAAGLATLLLTPIRDDAGVGPMLLVLESESAFPCSLIYDPEGDSMTIRMERLSSDSHALPRFKSSAYKEYEMIDFR